MSIKQVFAALLLLGLPSVCLAISLDSRPLPEPETLALLAVGALAWGIARWKNRK